MQVTASCNTASISRLRKKAVSMLRIHHQKVTSAKMIAVGSDKLCHRASVGGLTRTKQTRSQAFVGYLLDHLHEVSHSYQVVDFHRAGKHPPDPQEPSI